MKQVAAAVARLGEEKERYTQELKVKQEALAREEELPAAPGGTGKRKGSPTAEELESSSREFTARWLIRRPLRLRWEG